MTRKHYIELAKILNEYQANLNSGGNSQVYFDCMLWKLTDYLKEDNKNFDVPKFMCAVWENN